MYYITVQSIFVRESIYSMILQDGHTKGGTERNDGALSAECCVSCGSWCAIDWYARSLVRLWRGLSSVAGRAMPARRVTTRRETGPTDQITAARPVLRRNPGCLVARRRM